MTFSSVIIRILAFTWITVGIYFMYKFIPYALFPPESADLLPIVYSEALFTVLSYICIVVFKKYRLFVMFCFASGTATLYFLNTEFWLVGYKIPFLGLLGINLLVLLIGYFSSARDQWAPSEISAEEFNTPEDIQK